MKPEQVAVIGGGSWGSTIAYLIAKTGCRVKLWMRNEERVNEINTEHRNTQYTGDTPLSDLITATTDLEEAVSSCPCIFLVVTSASVRDVLHKMGDFINGSQMIIHCIKGFEHSSYKRISTIIKEETCCRKVGVLSGPNLAKEILQGHPSATVVASPFEEVVQVAQEVLISPFFRVYGHKDVIGVEVAGALKNIIALAAGMCGGMGFQKNTQSLLLTRGLVEITQFGIALGAQAATFRGLAGMGDLMATCSSSLSRNYQVGTRLSTGESITDVLESMSYVSEGVPTTKSVYHMSKNMNQELPITDGVFNILEGTMSPKEALLHLMMRENKYEELF